jgi:arylsulfatase A-like enzyme
MRPLFCALLLAAALPAAAASVSGTVKAPRYSVVLIAADGLRADRLGLYGYGRRPTSPRLDARAKDAVVFERAYAPATWTLPSFASVFTGLPPRRHGALSPVTVLPSSAPLLTEAFAAAGARTAGFVGGHFLDPLFGFDRGFETYRFGGWGDWQFLSTTAGQAERFIKEAGRAPFFVFAHGNDMHPPFQLPEADAKAAPPFDEGTRGGIVDRGLVDYAFIVAYNMGRDASRFVGMAPSDAYMAKVESFRADPGERERLEAYYDGRVREVEGAVERVFAALDAAGRRQDTIVVLMADHGMELGEHGKLAAAFHVGSGEGVLRVPLLVWHPALKGRRVRPPVSLQDLGATLLELAEVPGAALHGRSFAGLAREGREPGGERDILSVCTMLEGSGRVRQTAYIRGGWKLVFDDEGGRYRLFDLAADPGERRDLWNEKPEKGRELLAGLTGVLAAGR